MSLSALLRFITFLNSLCWFSGTKFIVLVHSHCCSLCACQGFSSYRIRHRSWQLKTELKVWIMYMFIYFCIHTMLHILVCRISFLHAVLYNYKFFSELYHSCRFIITETGGERICHCPPYTASLCAECCLSQWHLGIIYLSCDQHFFPY